MQACVREPAQALWAEGSRTAGGFGGWVLIERLEPHTLQEGVSEEFEPLKNEPVLLGPAPYTALNQ
jgi:hypothetical protein